VRIEDPLRRAARARGDHPAVVAPGGAVLSYRALDARVDGLRGRLAAAGVRRGDRVLALLHTGTALVELLHGVARIGAVLAPVDPRATCEEARWAASRIRPRLVVAVPEATDASALVAATESASLWIGGADEPVLDGAFAGEVIDGGDAAAADAGASPLDVGAAWTVVLTSGTTGRPRAVVATVGNHLASAHASAARLGVRPDDRWLACLPLHHVGGLALLVRAAVSATTVVLQRGFAVDTVLRALCDDGITQLSLVPTTLRRLLATPGASPHGLRTVLVGGARADHVLVGEARARGWPVATTYGLTEACSQVATVRPDEVIPHAGFVGAPLDGTCVRILRASGDAAAPGEVGEIAIAGPSVAAGALDAVGRIVPLASGGWLRTADRGDLDVHGCLTVLGRGDDVIVSGGENVSPDEVEGVLLAHPGVADAGVAGVPDAEWGQVVCAWIVPRGDAPTLDELRASCAARLARHKLPRRLVVLAALPRTSSGKLRRRALAASLEASASRRRPDDALG